MAHSDSTSRLLDTWAFATRLGVRPETVRRWVRRGRLSPAGRTPTGQLRFSEEQVADALRGPVDAPTRDGLTAHARAARAHVRALRDTLAAR